LVQHVSSLRVTSFTKCQKQFIQDQTIDFLQLNIVFDQKIFINDCSNGYMVTQNGLQCQGGGLPNKPTPYVDFMYRIIRAGLFQYVSPPSVFASPINITCPGLKGMAASPFAYCPFPTVNDTLFHMLNAMNGINATLTTSLMDGVLSQFGGNNGALSQQLACLLPFAWDTAGILTIVGPNITEFSGCSVQFNVLDAASGTVGAVSGSTVPEQCPVCNYTAVTQVTQSVNKAIANLQNVTGQERPPCTRPAMGGPQGQGQAPSGCSGSGCRRLLAFEDVDEVEDEWPGKEWHERPSVKALKSFVGISSDRRRLQVTQQQPPANGTQQPPMNGTQQQPMNGTQQQPMNGTQQPPMNGAQQQGQSGSGSNSQPKNFSLTYQAPVNSQYQVMSGMDCNQMQQVYQNLQRFQASQAFWYASLDAFAGCQAIVRRAVSLTVSNTTLVTKKCTLGGPNANPSQSSDPCCNTQLGQSQCCAQRSVTVPTRAIVRDSTGAPAVNATAFASNVLADPTGAGMYAQALYKAVTGYLDQETQANTQCAATMEAQLASMMDAWSLMTKCQNEVMGVYSSTYGQNIGKACSQDSDCYGTPCLAPTSSSSTSSSSS